jgi:brefeldin A-resistance guanine nucleotide exchange factor 1
MRMLQALLACLRAPAAPALGDQHVCTAVNTCFRVVHQAAAKSELLQRFSRHAMHELIRCVFARLPQIGSADGIDAAVKPEVKECLLLLLIVTLLLMRFLSLQMPVIPVSHS